MGFSGFPQPDAHSGGVESEQQCPASTHPGSTNSRVSLPPLYIPIAQLPTVMEVFRKYLYLSFAHAKLHTVTLSQQPSMAGENFSLSEMWQSVGIALHGEEADFGDTGTMQGMQTSTNDVSPLH